MDTNVARLVDKTIAELQLSSSRIRDSHGRLSVNAERRGMLLATVVDCTATERRKLIDQAQPDLSKEALGALKLSMADYDAKTLVIIAAAGAMLALIAERLPK